MSQHHINSSPIQSRMTKRQFSTSPDTYVNQHMDLKGKLNRIASINFCAATLPEEEW